MAKTTAITALGIMTLTMAACGNSDSGTRPEDPIEPQSKIATIDEGDGIYASQVDASDTDNWVYIRLADRQQVDPGEDPRTSTEWDIAFRRSNIKVNGGFSGIGGVEVSPIYTADFMSVSQAPHRGYSTDWPKAGVNPEQPDFINSDSTDFIFGRNNGATQNGWFNYDPRFHVLSPADIIFVVRTSGGQYFKLRLLDYYDQAGTPGFPTFRHSEIAPPDPSKIGIEIDASSRETPVYLNLLRAEVVTVNDPATSTDWDIMVQRTHFATNGGTSGSGLGGAAWAEEADTFDDVFRASTIGFALDTRVPPPGPPVPEDQWLNGNTTLASWFDYNPQTREVTPKDGFFLVRGADGESYFKLKLFSYEDGRYVIDIGNMQRSTASKTVTVNSAETDRWVYWSLRLGQLVETDDPTQSMDWDIAFSGTRIRTNSGTSGPGDAGAIEIPDQAFSSIFEAPEDGYIDDDMVQPNQPNGEAFSGNPTPIYLVQRRLL
ncbi:MAG: HmuY family protein [Myxococcota bacterium]